MFEQVAWDPSAEKTDDVTVEDSTCNPWKIAMPDHGGDADKLTWAMQITAPMPLEAISDLFGKAVALTANELLPSVTPDGNMISVTQDFFQSTPNGISKDNVDPQVLGFFSLVLSYAKAAKKDNVLEDQSPKELTSIMPRTEFVTIFAQVKDKISLTPDSLYQLVKILACYKSATE